MPFGIAGPLDPAGTGGVLVNLPADPLLAGRVKIQSSDGGDIDTSENNYLKTSSETLIFSEQVDGSSVNIAKWNPFGVSGMTIVQSAGFITLNAGAALTTAAYAILQSVRAIPLFGNLPMTFTFNAKVLNVPEANAIIELGIGSATGTTAPTDGAFFRWTSAGQFYAVMNNGGAETTAGPLTGTFTDNSGDAVVMPPATTITHLYQIEVVEDQIIFFVDDIQVAAVQTPAGQAYPMNAGRQQIYSRVYNGGTAPSLAPQLAIGQVIVNQEDLNQNKPWDDVLCSMGQGGYQLPMSAASGAASFPFGQTANKNNSASPTSGSLSNTVAAYTTLGGDWQFAAVAGAATDYLLFAFQIPAGFQHRCYGVFISSIVTGTAIGVSGTILEWGVAVGSSSPSLATVDGVGTWGPRRVPIGMQSFPALGAIGTMPSNLSLRLEKPLVTDGGRYFMVWVQIPVGLATGSQVLRGMVTLDHVFE